MYQLLRRPEGRPWARPDDWLGLSADDLSPADRPMVLQMRENRSSLNKVERQAFAMLGTCLAAMTIMPALKGYWLVPVFSLGALALLVLALGRHRASVPASESLELGAGRIVYRKRGRPPVELSASRLQFVPLRPSPVKLSLILSDANRKIEVGSCLSLEEREAIAPIIAAALSQRRGI